MGIRSANWGGIVVRGVAAVLFGLVATLFPGISLVVLVALGPKLRDFQERQAAP